MNLIRINSYKISSLKNFLNINYIPVEGIDIEWIGQVGFILRCNPRFIEF
jgi:hypothetical protein